MIINQVTVNAFCTNAASTTIESPMRYDSDLPSDLPSDSRGSNDALREEKEILGNCVRHLFCSQKAITSENIAEVLSTRIMIESNADKILVIKRVLDLVSRSR
ncbi:TPA: hypothetical protein R4Z25_000071 [Klebsiella oxytoca]|nr:hypothetical protein [Klebsiella oxytoca]